MWSARFDERARLQFSVVAQLHPKALGLSHSFASYYMTSIVMYKHYIFWASFSTGSLEPITPYQK
jgi:hypothetical protein